MASLSSLSLQHPEHCLNSPCEPIHCDFVYSCSRPLRTYNLQAEAMQSMGLINMLRHAHMQQLVAKATHRVVCILCISRASSSLIEDTTQQRTAPLDKHAVQLLLVNLLQDCVWGCRQLSSILALAPAPSVVEGCIVNGGEAVGGSSVCTYTINGSRSSTLMVHVVNIDGPGAKCNEGGSTADNNACNKPASNMVTRLASKGS